MMAQSFDISTLRLGTYKLKMPVAEAQQIAQKNLTVPSESNDYTGATTVDYYGENIVVTIGKSYDASGTGPATEAIIGISTQSPKFKTKSGIGIGSTYTEVFNAYKALNSFTKYPEYDDNGSLIKNSFQFSINDLDANTAIQFKFVNNKVVKITVTGH